MKINKAPIVYTFICNAPVSFMLTLTAQLVGNPIINWTNFAINFGVGYAIAVFVGLFFPLVKLGRWFTAKWDVDNETYTGNILYRMLATMSITLVFFFFVSPSLSILNHFLIPGSTPQGTVEFWCRCALPLLTVGFAVSLPADYVAYHIAHRIDPNF